MKTEYKLIKCYPGYDILGIIVSSENKNSEWQGTNYYEKYPEYWERVVEKNYKIVSICGTKNHPSPETILNIKDGYTNDFNGHLSHKNNCWKIHSIKRKSDNVIFTIGDKINRGSYKDIDVIRGFNLKDDLCLVSISDEIDRGYRSSKGVNISAIEHVKDVLFTTEDNIDIIESTTCFAISSHFFVYATNINKSVSKNWYLNKTIFYSKEKAEEYIIMNKPCLSINDISTMMNNHRGNHSFNNSVISNLLKALVKSKL